MKNSALFFTAVACAISFNCLAQNRERTQQLSQMMDDGDLAVVSYHVEERINMNFGSSVTTYDVPSLSMISDKDLGENNTRKITPKYAKVRAKVETMQIAASGPKISADTPNITAMPVNTDLFVNSITKPKTVDIDVVSTYERVMDKGYKSVAMITKVADKHFFNGDYILAAKWYTELFNSGTTDNLEAVYYYRYAQSLLETGQKTKGDEMMKIFETKSL